MIVQEKTFVLWCASLDVKGGWARKSCSYEHIFGTSFACFLVDAFYDQQHCSYDITTMPRSLKFDFDGK